MGLGNDDEGTNDYVHRSNTDFSVAQITPKDREENYNLGCTGTKGEKEEIEQGHTTSPQQVVDTDILQNNNASSNSSKGPIIQQPSSTRKSVQKWKN